ncbi:MAG: TolC family protein [Planctomycetota bacterium]|nr:MAG: TolC family protein [Planctomycetota bacterium]
MVLTPLFLALFAFQDPVSTAQDPANPTESPVLTDQAEQQAAPAPAADSGPRTLSLRVEDVVRLVLEHSPAVRQAHLRTLASEGSITEASGIFDPVLFGELTYSYSERENAGGFFSGGVSNTHIRSWQGQQGIRQTLLTGGTLSVSLNETYTEDNQPTRFFGFNPQSDVAFSASFSQPLLRGGWYTSTTSGIRQAELNYESQIATLRQTAQEDLQRAVDAYWDLAFALEDLEVKEFSLRLGEELKDVTEAKFRVGTAAEVEVVQTEADIAARRDALITARNLVEVRRDALRALIFRLEEIQDWELSLLPVSEPPPPDTVDLRWTEALEVARQFRPELRNGRILLEQARLGWEVARKNLLPKLDFTGTVNSSATREQLPEAYSPTFDFTAAGYSVGLVMEIPLGNRTFTGAERRSRLEYFLAHRSLRDQEHAIAGEVRDAVRTVNYLAERVRITLRAREVAERQLEAEQRRLKEGASTNFQVLQFQEDLVVALSNEKNAQLEYAKALTRLNTVQGLNWDGSSPQLPELEDYTPSDSPLE